MAERGSVRRGKAGGVLPLTLLIREEGAKLHSPEGGVKIRRLLDLIDRKEYSPITFEDLRLAEEGRLSLPRRPVILCFSGQPETIAQTVYIELRNRGFKGVMFIPGAGEAPLLSLSLDGRLAGGTPSARSLHILEMQAGGCEIGASLEGATVSPQLDADSLGSRVRRERELLEILLNAPVLSIVDPFGLLDSGAIGPIAAAGFRHLVTPRETVRGEWGGMLVVKGIKVPMTDGLPWLTFRLLSL